MIQQATWRGNEDVDAFDQLVCLGLAIGATHHNAKRLCVVLQQIPRHACKRSSENVSTRWRRLQPNSNISRPSTFKLKTRPERALRSQETNNNSANTTNYMPNVCSDSSRVGEMMMTPVPLRGVNLSL
jgi:hypothetical protein